MASGADTRTEQRLRRRVGAEEELLRHVGALLDLLAGAIGQDQVVLRAGKVSALKLLRSATLPDRLCALGRLVFEDPTLERVTTRAAQRKAIAEIEEALAELLAQRSVEDAIDRKVNEKVSARHQSYLNDLKIEALREDGGPETPATQAKLAELDALSSRKLALDAMARLRPAHLRDLVGQDEAVAALIAKISSPYPQHVILYGPPGVGKTTAARLALEAAKARPYAPFAKDAPFVEANGTTLRWDPRETTNPLLGSVHDPIYQGSRREFAESGVPEPKLGLVSRAHGGVLFIDEIGELDPVLQTRLLKVLEDKRVHFESSYFDESAPNVPEYVKRLFREGAPADFILIGATTREPEEIDPAIRSRCAELYFSPLTQNQIVTIAQAAMRRLGATGARGIAQQIATYTIEGRKAVQLVADAYGVALARSSAGKRRADALPAHVNITQEDLQAVLRSGRFVAHTPARARSRREVGKAFGLGVLHHVGSLIEIEALAFPASAPGKGSVRFNETAGTMARDSVFNAGSVLRALLGTDPADFDLHVNVIGGGNIDGPSAGLAILLALYSALARVPLPQDVAVTGELSLAGKVRGVGGVVEKLYAARQAGMRAIVLPAENAREIDARLSGIEVIAAHDVAEVLRALRIKRAPKLFATKSGVSLKTRKRSTASRGN